MKATQQFISDAIKGGWKEGKYKACEVTYVGYVKLYIAEEPTVTEIFNEGMPLTNALLDPLAWQAVGKTRGWEDPAVNFGKNAKILGSFKSEWLFNQHVFIDHLADGDSVEEALSTIN